MLTYVLLDKRNYTAQGCSRCCCLLVVVVVVCVYLGFDRFGVLVLEQEFDLAFPVVGGTFELGELVSPQHHLQVMVGGGKTGKTHYEDRIFLQIIYSSLFTFRSISR